MALIKPLSAELQKVAIDELGEVPSRVVQDLEDFKDWIKLQPHLRARSDDQYLIQFLRGCKYSLEKAKKKLDYIHAIRTKWPEMFHLTDVDNKKFREFHNTGAVLPLPIPLHGFGPRIVLMRFNFSLRVFDIEEAISYTGAVHELMIVRDPYAGINGLVYVIDLAHCAKEHMTGLQPKLLKILIGLKERAMPFRLRACYIINAGIYLEPFLKMAFSCVPEKLRKGIFACGKNLDSLAEYLPHKYLPLDYGGENGSLQELCAEYNLVWDEYREYFKRNAEYGTDEHLRLGEPLWSDIAEFGSGGSFRKIEVD